MEENQTLAPAVLEADRAIKSFNKLYENVGTSKKINPSKSRQGRAVLVNGALRNPTWDRGYGRSHGLGRAPGRRHPRTLEDYQIQGLKDEAKYKRTEIKDYVDQKRHELSKINKSFPAFHQYLDTLQVSEGRRVRDIECQVSRELDMCWTVDTKAGAETFVVKLPEAA